MSASKFHNPGAPGMIASAVRHAQAHILPPAGSYLGRAEALADALTHLEQLRRAALRAGTTSLDEPLHDQIEAMRDDLEERLEEILGFGAHDDDLDGPDPEALADIEVLNIFALDGRNLRRGERAQVPPKVAAWLHGKGKARPARTTSTDTKGTPK
jgi:predicted phage gp36 major capsid-like protein